MEAERKRMECQRYRFSGKAPFRSEPNSVGPTGVLHWQRCCQHQQQNRVHSMHLVNALYSTRKACSRVHFIHILAAFEIMFHISVGRSLLWRLAFAYGHTRCAIFNELKNNNFAGFILNALLRTGMRRKQ